MLNAHIFTRKSVPVLFETQPLTIIKSFVRFNQVIFNKILKFHANKIIQFRTTKNSRF